MSQCVSLLNGYVVSSESNCDYVLLTTTELEELNTGLDGNLNIDSQLYSSVTGYLLLSLVGGHVLGRIVKGLGRG